MMEAPRLVNGSNLMDKGRSSAWCALADGAPLGVGLCDPDFEALGRAAVAAKRCCRGKAGHHPRQSVIGERGKRPGVALPILQPVGWRADSPPVDGTGAWRRLRSTPGTGKAVHMGKGASRLQWHRWGGGRS